MDDSVQLLRSTAYAELRRYLGAEKCGALERSAARLVETTSHGGDQARNVVLAMFGGGKDSSFMVAAVRFIQLCIAERYGATFTLRVATNVHVGMPDAVIENIARVYTALGLDRDPGAELLVIEGHQVKRFEPSFAVAESTRVRDRTAVLMNGHRCHADPRPTFCNACNFSMENAVALAIGHGRSADVVVTGDSPEEQRYYAAWVRHASRRLGIARSTGTPGLRSFLENLKGIEQSWLADVFGDLVDEVVSRELRIDAIRKEPVFFSIYEEAAYEAGDHWELLTEYLGFRFDEIAFSFTESDCGNPGLMAHLRGLRYEHLLCNRYANGVREYTEYALRLMRRKRFPESLMETMVRRYADEAAIGRMRGAMGAYASRAFGLSDEQLVCMVHSPFAEAAKNLPQYLRREQPDLVGYEERIRALHAGATGGDEELDDRLKQISGLPLAHRRVLHAAPLVPTHVPDAPAVGPISIILARDPHKEIVERTTQTGAVVRERITGR